MASAQEVGAEAVQIFASNPRGWAAPQVERQALEAVAATMREAGLGPLYLHAPYLVNPASAHPVFLEKSAATLRWTLERAAWMEAGGVVVHAGSAGETPRAEAVQRVRGVLAPLLDVAPVPVVIELTAGGSGAVASRWPQAAELLSVLGDHPRVRFCFDTCHAYAAGYDVGTAAGMHACLDEMRAEIGADRLALIHVNNSKDPLGSRRDRHEQLAKGTIGEDGFRALVRSSLARSVPLIVETPIEGQRDDIAVLRRLARG